MKGFQELLLVVLLSAAWLLPAQAEVTALEQIRQAGAMRVGTAGNYQPMSFLDPGSGNLCGL